MITGLRLAQEGVNEDEFQSRFGQSGLMDVYGKEIDELLKLGFMEFARASGG